MRRTPLALIVAAFRLAPAPVLLLAGAEPTS